MRRKRVPSFLYIFSCILQRSLGKVCCLKQRSASHRSLIMPSFGLTSSSVGMALFLPLPCFPLSRLSSPYSSYILSLCSSISVHSTPLSPFTPGFVPVTSRSLSQPRSFLGKERGLLAKRRWGWFASTPHPNPLICLHPARFHCTPLRRRRGAAVREYHRRVPP